MPAKSEAQRRFIYAVKGAEFAKKHHFDNKGKLPQQKMKPQPRPSRDRRGFY